MKTVLIDTSKIIGWESFHDVFADTLGFPDYYGRNMNAWIDCMSSIGVYEEAWTAARGFEVGEKLLLDIPNAKAWKDRCPDIFEAFMEDVAFSNYRNLEVGEAANLLLFLH